MKLDTIFKWSGKWYVYIKLPIFDFIMVFIKL